MIANLCPPRERLHAYLQGTLAPADADSLDGHLNKCSDCQAAMDTLDDLAVPDLARLANPGASKPTVPDPLLQQLLARAKAIPAAGLSSPKSACLQRDIEGFPDWPQGKTLGNYELLEQIGAGGQGTVGKAYHCRMKRVVALKLLPQSLLSTPEMRRRFDREIETIGKVSHPNIVTAYDAGEEDGRTFLVMEFVDGPDLARLVRQNGTLPVSLAVDYIRQAAQGLTHAHAAGIVHRDIKPANLLLDAQGVVKVSDLGLARLLQTEEKVQDPNLTGQRTIMGTLAYMAPEQALDSRQVDHRADIYGLGCTLFFLLTGTPPVTGKNLGEVVNAHHEQPIPALRQRRTDCPAALDAVCQRMLARHPEDRYGSMEEVLAALAQIPAVVGGKANPPSRTVLASSSSHTSASVHSRRRWPFAVAALALAAGLLLVLLFSLDALFPAITDGNTLVGQPGNEGKNPANLTTPEKNPPGPSNQSGAPPGPPIIEMVRIEAGDMMMGASDGDNLALGDERPQHEVKISQPFSLGKFEVTQQQYQQVMGENPSAFSAKGRFKEKVTGLNTASYPVESVTWMNSVRFCNLLSDMHKVQKYYEIDGEKVKVKGGPGYRLPTEAEWEYACRGGTTTIWSFGNDHQSLIDDYAWYAKNSDGKTHPVGTKKANPFGLFDMHGNVPEWCWDHYEAEYYKKGAKIFDPVGPGTGTTRVYRGGGWDLGLAKTRSSARTPLNFLVYGDHYTIVGLRVAKNAE